jgi:hypothetical protein
MVNTLADWNLRGPVHTVLVEQASCGAEAPACKPVRQLTTATFRANGQTVEVVSHNPDGSTAHQACDYDDDRRLTGTRSWMNDDVPTRVSYEYDAHGRILTAVRVTPDGSRSEVERSTYDEAGRRTRIEVLPALSEAGDAGVSYGVEGSGASYSAPGAATLATDYDERGLPAAATFRDALDRLILRVSFTRDDEGRVLTEEARIGGPAAGRLIERTARFGAMSEERTAYAYGHHGDVVGETSSGWSRSMTTGDGGGADEGERDMSEHATRYEYQYDAEGNWIEKITFVRSGPDAPFRRAQLGRRTITYFERRPRTVQAAATIP